MIKFEKLNSGFNTRTRSFTDNLDQHPFASATVKLAIKNLFPGAEIESAVGDGNNNLPAHDLPFHMGVGVVFTDIVPVYRKPAHGERVFPARHHNRDAGRTRRH